MSQQAKLSSLPGVFLPHHEAGLAPSQRGDQGSGVGPSARGGAPECVRSLLALPRHWGDTSESHRGNTVSPEAQPSPPCRAATEARTLASRPEAWQQCCLARAQRAAGGESPLEALGAPRLRSPFSELLFPHLKKHRVGQCVPGQDRALGMDAGQALTSGPAALAKAPARP